MLGFIPGSPYTVLLLRYLRGSQNTWKEVNSQYYNHQNMILVDYSNEHVLIFPKRVLRKDELK